MSCEYWIYYIQCRTLSYLTYVRCKKFALRFGRPFTSLLYISLQQNRAAVLRETLFWPGQISKLRTKFWNRELRRGCWKWELSSSYVCSLGVLTSGARFVFHNSCWQIEDDHGGQNPLATLRMIGIVGGKLIGGYQIHGHMNWTEQGE
jgi:hypothetical protein